MSKPPSPAAGRKTGKRPADHAALRARLPRSRARGMPKFLEERGRRLLDAYLSTAETEGQPYRTTLAELGSGEAARKLAEMTGAQIRAENPPQLAHSACSEGCAFCCVLLEGDGGLITEAEARNLHAAAHPLAGQPDGRAWNAHACAVLDPETRKCRAYDVRPTVCRSFISVDAEACAINADGGDEDGSGMLGNHLDYLAVLSLSRDLMRGTTLVATYSLEQVAIAAVEGLSLGETLKAARHRSAELDETCEDIGNSPS